MAGERCPQRLPSPCPARLGTRDVPEPCVRATGRGRRTTPTVVGREDGGRPAAPCHPSRVRAGEPRLTEPPCSADAALLRSVKPSISQVAINGEFLTNLKPWLLSSKTNERAQQKGTVFQDMKYYVV